MSKRGLGKGIDALFQSVLSEEAAEASGTEDSSEEPRYVSVPLAKVRPNPNQPRKEFREAALHELADSIREKGVIQPLLVEEMQGGDFLIVAGERRYRAAALAGLESVPVLVRHLSEEEKLEIALIENIQREDLTPLEEARAYRSLLDSTGISQDELATKIGKNRSTIANSLRLLKLPEDVQASLNDRSLSAGHARALLMVVNPADQRILFSRIIDKGLSVREAEDMAADLNKGLRAATAGGTGKIPKKKLPELSELEQKLIDRLGTKVSIKGSGKRGSVEIAYFSMEDLERVIDLLLGR